MVGLQIISEFLATQSKNGNSVGFIVFIHPSLGENTSFPETAKDFQYLNLKEITWMLRIMLDPVFNIIRRGRLGKLPKQPSSPIFYGFFIKGKSTLENMK